MLAGWLAGVEAWLAPPLPPVLGPTPHMALQSPLQMVPTHVSGIESNQGIVSSIPQQSLKSTQKCQNSMKSKNTERAVFHVGRITLRGFFKPHLLLICSAVILSLVQKYGLAVSLIKDISCYGVMSLNILHRKL